MTRRLMGPIGADEADHYANGIAPRETAPGKKTPVSDLYIPFSFKTSHCFGSQA